MFIYRIFHWPVGLHIRNVSTGGASALYHHMHMKKTKLFAYSILVTGSEIRSCEQQISLFHHHQSSRPITTSQQAFDKTLRSPPFL